MRCSGWSSLAISACSALALLLAGSAAAHVDANPPFLATGGSASIDFVGPNERPALMNGFSVTVPPGLAIEHAHEADGWSESIEGRTATWTGGTLAPNEIIDFGATIAAQAAPGTVEVLARQLYADGEVVRWTVRMTVTPESDSPSQNLALAGIVALIGVLLVVALALLAWRRRAPA